MMEYTKATLQICKFYFKRIWYKLTRQPEGLLLVDMIIDNSIGYDACREIVRVGVSGEENQKVFLDLITFFEDAEKRGETLTKEERKQVKTKLKANLKAYMEKKK